MRRYSLRVQSIISLLKSFESLTTTIKSVKPSSMPASGTGVGDVSLITRPEVVTCQSTNADAVNDAQPQPPHHAQTPSTDGKNDVLSTSSGNSSGHDVDMDVSEAMSNSALIAFNYRLHSSENTTTPQSPSSSFLSSKQTPMMIDAASCLPVSRSMSELKTAESVSFHDQLLPLKRSKAFKLHSMLCDAPPVIIDLTQEQDDGYGILQEYRRDPHNIILDSLHPELAPHIVITPADDKGDLFEISQNNRTGPQYFPYLSVPPFFGSTCRMHTYEEYMSLFYPPTYYPQLVPGPSRAHYRKVSSFSSLSQINDWQSFIHDLGHVLIAKAHKQVAIAASLKAPAFRSRYEVPQFIEYVGWLDPANVIFAHRSQFCTRQSVVLKSDSPRVTPHIIIDFAPPIDPSFSSSYPALSRLQDQTCLLAPLPYELMNIASNEDSSVTQQGLDVNSDSFSDTFSDSSSIGPQTPTELQRVGSGFFAKFAGEIEEDITSAYGGHHKEYRTVTVGFGCSFLEDHGHDVGSDIQEDAPSPKFFISSNDDDDDDDWDAESLPDIETDPWFVEARARSAAAVLLGNC